MLTEFENKIAAYTVKTHIFKSQRKILVAVSGGADSIALLAALRQLKIKGNLDSELIIGHINHKLRGQQSNEDEKFVRQFASKLEIDFISQSVDVRDFSRKHKLSIETAARNLRQGALISIAENNSCGYIATGHHKNDNSETMVHRLLRGTGMRGLCGIWPVRNFGGGGLFIRPMLCVKREEIEGYCREKSLIWRSDETNLDTSYTRNRIRHLLLPQLQVLCSTDLIDSLFELSESCRGLYERVCSEVEGVWGEIILESDGRKIVLDRGVFVKQFQAIQVEIARRALVSIGSGERYITAVHYNEISHLAGKSGLGKIELPGGFWVRCEYGKMIFSSFSVLKTGIFLDESVDLRIGGGTEFGGYRIESEVFEANKCDFEGFLADKDEFVEWFDYDKVRGGIVVRWRREGDKFRPIGGLGEKRVGKFITAEKVGYELRERLIVFAACEKVIWLGPLRASESTKITAETSKILQIRLCR